MERLENTTNSQKEALLTLRTIFNKIREDYNRLQEKSNAFTLEITKEDTTNQISTGEQIFWAILGGFLGSGVAIVAVFYVLGPRIRLASVHFIKPKPRRPNRLPVFIQTSEAAEMTSLGSRRS